MTETAAPGGTPVGTRADYTIPYQSEMTEIRISHRDNFEESYVVGLKFVFEDRNDDINIKVPGFDSLDTK